MPDVKEVFELVTQKSRPDPGALGRQHTRQDSRDRRKRITALAAAALLVAVVAGAFLLAQSVNDGTGPAHRSTSVTVPVLYPAKPLIVGLDGRVRGRLLNIPPDADSLNLSPDGRTVVFVASQRGLPQVGTIGARGTGLTFLTHMSGATIPSTPVWSPDGRRIAFADRQIYVMDADGSNLRRLTSGSRVDQWPSWSPDGSTIAYSNSGKTFLDESGFSPTQEIWTVPASGGTPTRLTHNIAADDMPFFSPNGGRIAFFSDGGIAIMDPNGRHVHLLRNLPTHVFNPRWSPDGSRLAFIQYRPGPGALDRPLLTVHVIDLKTGTLTTIPGKVASDANAVQWASDTTLIENRYVG